MSGWQLTLTHRGAGQIDASDLVPDQLAHLSKDAVASTEVRVGARLLPLSSVFDIDGAGEADKLSILGASQKLQSVGGNMKSGELHVRGDVDARTGANMSGGRLIVDGNAGDYVGAAQSGGRIEIHGDAGDFVAAATPGQRYGMRGGAIVIKGNAGNRLADRLRRGSVFVDGNCGDFAASRVVAGTIVVTGDCGRSPAMGMRRGTLLMTRLMTNSGDESTPFAENLPGYAASAPLTSAFLALLLTSIDDLNGSPDWRQKLRSDSADRWLGDRRVDGRAELLRLQHS